MNADTRRLVTTTSPESGPMAGGMAAPGSLSAIRPEPAIAPNVLLRWLTSGYPARNPTTT